MQYVTSKKSAIKNLFFATKDWKPKCIKVDIYNQLGSTPQPSKSQFDGKIKGSSTKNINILVDTLTGWGVDPKVNILSNGEDSKDNGILLHLVGLVSQVSHTLRLHSLNHYM